MSRNCFLGNEDLQATIQRVTKVIKCKLDNWEEIVEEAQSNAWQEDKIETELTNEEIVNLFVNYGDLRMVSF